MWNVYDTNVPISKTCFDEVYELLCASLPKEERRQKAAQWALTRIPAYRLYVHVQERVVAFLAAWEFESLRFIEHFAVSPALRGQGMGGKLLNAYVSLVKLPVVLEVEPPARSPVAARRVGFYERHGFHLNTNSYHQPPLNAGDPSIPLMLMSLPTSLEQEGCFEKVRGLLYKNVYQLNDAQYASMLQKDVSLPPLANG